MLIANGGFLTNCNVLSWRNNLIKLVFNYRLKQVKSIAERSKGEHSAYFPTFFKLLFVIMIFALSIFEWPFYTGFTDNKDLEQVGENILYISYISLISFGLPL